MLECDPPPQLANRLARGLHHFWVGVDQREHPLAGREALLKLAPERGDAGEWEQEDAERLDEQIPITGRHCTGECAPPAVVDHQRGSDAADQIEGWEDRI